MIMMTFRWKDLLLWSAVDKIHVRDRQLLAYRPVLMCFSQTIWEQRSSLSTISAPHLARWSQRNHQVRSSGSMESSLQNFDGLEWLRKEQMRSAKFSSWQRYGFIKKSIIVSQRLENHIYSALTLLRGRYSCRDYRGFKVRVISKFSRYWYGRLMAGERSWV